MSTAPVEATNPAARYRAAADRFTQLVVGTSDWDAPTPVVQWHARDVVGHLVTWFPPMLAEGSEHSLVVTASAKEDPPAAWAGLDGQVRALLEDPEIARSEHHHEQLGTQTIEALVDQYLTTDVVLHAWDLARATGQDDTINPHEVAALLEGMTSMEETIRMSGQFGDQQPLPPAATDQERLMAFLGRDPRWEPEAP